MEKNYKILAINPGSTTTKLAYYADGEMKNRLEVFHPAEELANMEIIEQLPMRIKMVSEFLAENNIDVAGLDMIVARGANLPNIKTGAYKANDVMTEYLYKNTKNHASSLACLIARGLGDPFNIPCIIYDSVSANDYLPEATVSGLPEVPHNLVCHVLNTRMVGHVEAAKMGKKYEECRFIIAHIGGGSSVSAHADGRILDCFTNDRAQMSPERAGGLSNTHLAELCYSGKYTESEMMKLLMGKGGMVQYLGTQDMRKVEDMVNSGDEKAIFIVRSMAYQLARSIMAMLAPLNGKVDKIIYTGGMCRFKKFVEMTKEYVGWIPSVEYPGEFEMEGLVQGAERALRGEEEAREYSLA